MYQAHSSLPKLSYMALTGWPLSRYDRGKRFCGKWLSWEFWGLSGCYGVFILLVSKIVLLNLRKLSYVALTGQTFPWNYDRGNRLTDHVLVHRLHVITCSKKHPSMFLLKTTCIYHLEWSRVQELKKIILIIGAAELSMDSVQRTEFFFVKELLWLSG